MDGQVDSEAVKRQWCYLPSTPCPLTPEQGLREETGRVPLAGVGPPCSCPRWWRVQGEGTLPPHVLKLYCGKLAKKF